MCIRDRVVGSTCNDGDSTTENDVYQADGCTCAGTPIQTGCNPAYVISNGTINVSGLNGEHNSINVFDTDDGWATVFSCFDDCGNPALIGLPEGNYYIHIKILDAAYQIDCEIMEHIVVTGNCTLEGTSCDDNDDCTENDTFNENCNCVGTSVGDADGDGVCTNEDCDDNDASVPTNPGTPCDDGNPVTFADVILIDGCTCQGTTPLSCDSSGGDADGDGICADVDCDDNDASLPADAGTSCDDGDETTENDEIQADGCTCAGTPISSGCGLDYTVNGLSLIHI